MDKVVGSCQSNFLKNRQAADNEIIVQEIIHFFRKAKGKTGHFLMKIDLKKAFDKLEWSFIRTTLIYVNLPSNLVNLIMSCICSTTTAVLINGSRTDFFKPIRGICQGDPVSPYIFILCMEVLSRNIDDVVTSTKWDPVRTSKKGPAKEIDLSSPNVTLTSNSQASWVKPSAGLKLNIDGSYDHNRGWRSR